MNNICKNTYKIFKKLCFFSKKYYICGLFCYTNNEFLYFPNSQLKTNNLQKKAKKIKQKLK